MASYTDDEEASHRSVTKNDQILISDRNTISKQKVILVGDSKVGKTSLIKKLLNISDIQEVVEKSYCIQGSTLILEIFDTVNQESYGFTSLPRLFYRNTNAVLFVYDCSKKESFENIPEWISQVRDADEDMKRWSFWILVCNQIDRSPRLVTKQEGQKLANENNMEYIEVSCRTGNNVEKLFERTAREISQSKLAKSLEKDNDLSKKSNVKLNQNSSSQSPSKNCKC